MIISERLDCGIRLVTERMNEATSVTIGVWVGTGSRDEPDEIAGASHFMEHLLFKGTPEWSASSIAEAVDQVGGDMNAFTTKEYTAFYMRLLASDLPLGLDVLGAIMTNPALRPAEVDAERQVILDEIMMHADEAPDLAAEQFMGALFPGHPLGRDVLGTETSVASVSVSELRAFFEAQYLNNNMVVAAAGDLDHDRLREEIERRFKGRTGGADPSRTPPGAEQSAFAVTSRPMEQVQLVLGTRIPGRRSPQRWALALLNHALGGGISSRLFQEVRERRGLCYSIWSERNHYAETGTLTVHVGTAPSNARQVLGLVNDEVDRLAEDGVSERELEIAKGHVRAEVLLSLEDSGARMNRIGSSLLLQGEVLEVEDILEKVKSVGLDEIGDVAAEMASRSRTLSVVGPVSQEDLTAEA